MRFPIHFALLGASFLLSGCSKKVTEQDCRAVGDHLRELWQAEWTKVSPAQGADKPTNVVKGEAEKLAADWASDCKAKLVGSPSDGKDMRCLLDAKTVADMRKCSEL